MSLLAGKIAIVSGIGPGMGRDIALLFAREGADLALGARSREYVEGVAKEVRALGRRAIAVPTDIAVPDDCADWSRARRPSSAASTCW